jgi:predicted enzyme related to lactoylglutathione lyase
MMSASKCLVSAICASAIALIVAVPIYAQDATQHPQQTLMPRGPIKTPIGRSPSDVLFSKISVSDMHKSFEFYTKLIGLKQAISTAQKEPPPPPGLDSKTWPGEIGLNFSGSFADPFFDIIPARDKPLTRETADMIVIGFKVPDAAAVVQRVREAGYEVIREAPVVGPGEMSIGMVRDPDGYRLEILQAASYPARSSK